MSLLKTVKSGNELKPSGLVISIAGANGMGKTPLALTGWRSPILLIQGEDGVKHPKLVEKIGKTVFKTDVGTNSDQLIETLEELNKQEKIEYKTVVIDTVTQFSNMYETEMLANADEMQKITVEADKKEALKKMTVGGANGGFFKAAGMVKNYNTRVANLIKAISAKGVSFVLLFQTSRIEIKTAEGQSYDVTSFSLISAGKNDQQMATQAYTSISDIVAYIDMSVQVSKASIDGIKDSNYEKPTALGNYAKYLIMGDNINYHNAKNRLSGENKILYTVGENPLLPAIKNYISNFNKTKEVNENGVN